MSISEYTGPPRGAELDAFVQGALKNYQESRRNRTSLAQVSIEEAAEIVFGTGEPELAAILVLIGVWRVTDRHGELLDFLWRECQIRGLRRLKIVRKGDRE